MFNFKHFQIQQSNAALKVGTDAMVLGAHVKAQNPKYVLDIGTGTGVLALMMAQKFTECQIIGIDNDRESLKDCKFNFKNSTWSNRLTFKEHSIFDFQPEIKFDLIISNPPFYENGLNSTYERSTNAKHVVHFPLDQLFEQTKKLLTETGDFWIILDALNHEKWIQFNAYNHFFCHTHIRIFGNESNFNRSILVFSKIPKELKESDFVIRTKEGKYTDEYKSLTSEFHNKKLD